MQRSKLVDLVRNLTQTEIDRVGAFIQKKNGAERLQRFWMTLIHQLATGKSLDKGLVWMEAFPESPFSESKLKDLMTRTIGAIRTVLTSDAVASDQFGQDLYMLKTLSIRRCEKMFHWIKKRMERQLVSFPEDSAKRHALRFSIEEEDHRFAIINRPRNSKPNYERMTLALEREYLIRRLRIVMLELNAKKILLGDELESTESGKKHDDSPMPKHLQELAQKHFDRPGISLLYEVCQYLVSPSYSALLGLGANYWKWSSALDQEVQYDVLGFLINELILAENAGQIGLVVAAYFLLLLGFEIRLFADGERANPVALKNLLKLCLKLNRIDQARKYLKQYGKSLPGSHFHLNWALVHYFSGDYSKAEENLRHFNFKENVVNDVFLRIGVRTLQIKIEYEKGEIEVAQRYTRNLLDLLKRSKQLNINIVANCVNRLNAVLRLIRCHSNGEYMEFRTWLINTSEKLDDKHWLLRMVENKLDGK